MSATPPNVNAVSCSCRTNTPSTVAVSGSIRERVVAFANVLQNGGIVTTIRKTRGDDIDAACGQLAGEVQDRTRVQARMASRVITLQPRHD